MNTELHQRLEFYSAYRKPREAIRDYILKNREGFLYLLQMAFVIDYKFYFKACWIIEFLTEEKLDWLQPQLNFFLQSFESF